MCGFHCTYVFLGGMSPKLPGEHVEDLLADPTAFGERGEGEVIRIDLPQAELGLVVIRGLVIPLIRKSGSFGLQSLRFQFGLFHVGSAAADFDGRRIVVGGQFPLRSPQIAAFRRSG